MLFEPQLPGLAVILFSEIQSKLKIISRNNESESCLQITKIRNKEEFRKII